MTPYAGCKLKLAGSIESATISRQACLRAVLRLDVPSAQRTLSSLLTLIQLFFGKCALSLCQSGQSLFSPAAVAALHR
jgi:hypothetical protein